ncbi:hypothetical protein FHR90_000684 [Endobacter medicaginis]|uniref:Transmembrane protein n=1 Tax=Endobacter medicaginis TaxID=1181271 RepID=A0A850NMB7_9PROT|nr:hypothetical protein [Endobacter medicaginis]MBB3172870.1 hypothetical protein [Endobacter medicaginis]MCX5474796.1 hypothetical protein [Endobacter medicaginis]NVN30064.1 hypothetical protein [Endobacter medicaginis]
MPTVPLTRLYVLRLMYLVLFVLVPLMTAARMIYSGQSLGADDGWGFAACLLAAMSLLCGLGLRYPLKMLPLLFFEVVWKVIWAARVAAPLWISGKIDDALTQNSIAIGSAVVVLAVLPWRYVVAQYVRAPGDAWKSHR